MTCELLIEEGTPLSTFNSGKTTMQPNSLLRLPVFTPTGRVKQTIGRSSDVSALRDLEFCRAEGYEKAHIFGPKLSIETDFKVWCGIVKVFRKGYSAKGFKLTFLEFAKTCGFDSRTMNKVLRKRIDRSLTRIMSQVLTFEAESGKIGKYHLVQNAFFDPNGDTIEIIPDRSLWELYQADYKTLVGMKVIENLPRYETASCLYLFLNALPQNPIDLSFERLRNRLQINASVAEQNRSIREAIKKLVEIGYLKCSEIKKNGEAHLVIHSRDPKLKMGGKAPIVMDDDDEIENAPVTIDAE